MSITQELPGDWIVVNPEWVISENPDFIVRDVFAHIVGPTAIGLETSDDSQMEDLRVRIISEGAIESTTAAINENVYLVDGDLMQQ